MSEGAVGLPEPSHTLPPPAGTMRDPLTKAQPLAGPVEEVAQGALQPAGGPAQPPPVSVSKGHAVTAGHPHIREEKKKQALEKGFMEVQRTAEGLSVTDKSSLPNQVESLAQEYVEEAIAEISGQPPRYPSMSVLYNGGTYTVEQRGDRMRVTGPQAGQSNVMANVLKMAQQQNLEAPTKGFRPEVFAKCINLAEQQNQIRVISPQDQSKARVLAQAALFKSGFTTAFGTHVEDPGATTRTVNATFAQMRTRAATSRAIPFLGNPDPATPQIPQKAKEDFGTVIRYLYENPTDPAVKYAQQQQPSSQPETPEAEARPPAKPSRPPEAATRASPPEEESSRRMPEGFRAANPGSMNHPELFIAPWENKLFFDTYKDALAKAKVLSPEEPEKQNQFAYAYALTVWSLTPQGLPPTEETLRKAQKYALRFQSLCSMVEEKTIVPGLLKFLLARHLSTQPSSLEERGQQNAAIEGFYQFPKDPELRKKFLSLFSKRRFVFFYDQALKTAKAEGGFTLDQARQYALGYATVLYYKETGLQYYEDQDAKTIYKTANEYGEFLVEQCWSSRGGEPAGIEKLMKRCLKFSPPHQRPWVALLGGFPVVMLRDKPFRQILWDTFDNAIYRNLSDVENWDEKKIAQFAFVYAVYVSQGIPEADAGSKAYEFVNNFSGISPDSQKAFISRHLLPPEFPQTAFENYGFTEAFQKGLENPTFEKLYENNPSEAFIFAFAYAAYMTAPKDQPPDQASAAVKALKFVGDLRTAKPDEKKALISQLLPPSQ
jgi:hypothetical protein